MVRKAYGEGRSRWQVVVGSKTGARHVVEALAPFTRPGANPLITPEEVITPLQNGDGYVLHFAARHIAHNKYNTKHDVGKRVRENFAKRPHLEYDLKMLNESWSPLRCDDHDDCCQTGIHRDWKPGKKPCVCEAKKLSV